MQLPSRRSSDDENNHFVVNASFQRRSTDNAEDTTLQSPRDRSASGTTRGEERTETQAESAFFRSTYKISQPDPGRVAPRSSEQIMLDPRFLGHQVLFKDRVFSDSGDHRPWQWPRLSSRHRYIMYGAFLAGRYQFDALRRWFLSPSNGIACKSSFFACRLEGARIVSALLTRAYGHVRHLAPLSP